LGKRKNREKDRFYKINFISGILERMVGGYI